MFLKTRTTRQRLTKWAIFCLFFCLILLISIFGLKPALADFQEPIAQPPEENQPGFITVGSDHQVKSGKLRLGTDDMTAPFDYQLEVRKTGANINDVIIDNDLIVDTDTLYVDSFNHRVGIGTSTPFEKLSVDGNMIISNELTGIGLAGWSEDDHALYGKTSDSSYAGVYGMGTGADSYGVAGYNYDGTAVEGINTTNSISSVYGESANGMAVYGTNSYAQGLWAGYFVGRLESSVDVSGAKFVPTQLQASLVPFTSGQIVTDYDYVNKSLHYFDGTYVWASKHNKLTKIRAADGFRIFEKEIDNSVWSDNDITDVIYDGNYIWATVTGNQIYPGNDKPLRIAKIDPTTGETVCDNINPLSGSSYTLSDARSVAFDGQYYWVLDRPAVDQGVLIKISNLCEQVSGGQIVLANGTADSEVNFYSGKVIYNGSYLVVTGSDYSTTYRDRVVIFNANPSSGKAVGWKDFTADSHYNPADIFFDNYFYWVTNKGSTNHADNSITKFYYSDKICTFSNDKQGDSCVTDRDCDVTGDDGACFPMPEEFETYTISSISNPFLIAFDGTYIWVANDNWNEPGVVRLLAADPIQQLGLLPNNRILGVMFDGTYLWASTNGYKIKKLYTGTGYGGTDLSEVLTLWQNPPIYDDPWGNPGDPRSGYPQSGSINIDGSGRVGEDVKAEGELEVSNNLWGEEKEDGSDVIENGGSPLGQGTYNCPEGHFVKNIITNASGEVTQIECRPL